jgi:hypothetical protein
MQRAAGVASFGDINQLLSTAPRDVVELLRIAGGIVTTGGGVGGVKAMQYIAFIQEVQAEV